MLHDLDSPPYLDPVLPCLDLPCSNSSNHPPPADPHGYKLLTLPASTSSLNGASLLASIFLFHLVLPRQRIIAHYTMEEQAGNAHLRASQLRPPGSRLPAPNMRPATLNEMSDSQNNVRAQPSMLPQSGIKRPQSNSVSQLLPDPKQRKTLMERAGEFPGRNSATATPAPRAANKGVSLASQSGAQNRIYESFDLRLILRLHYTHRNSSPSQPCHRKTPQLPAKMRFLPLPKQLLRAATPSLRHARPEVEDTPMGDHGSTELDDFSVVEKYVLDGFCGTIELRYEAEIKPPSTAMPLSRHQSSKSMSSRATPNSFTQSVGPNAGRPASMIGRAQTSMSFHRTTDNKQRPNASSRIRPQTAMTNHQEEDDLSTGKQTFQYMGPRASVPSRDISISTMMGNLSLDDERANGSFLRRNQAVSTKENCPPSPTSLRQSDFLLENVTFRPSQLRREDGTATPITHQEDSRASIMAPPKTPPPSVEQARGWLDRFEDTLLASTRRCPESPSKSPSKTSFLTKDSNLPAFTAWDMDERLVEVEAQFKAMKEVMNVSLTDKKAMEEVIEMAKTRANDLERERNRLDEKNTSLQNELESMRQQLQSLTLDLEQERRSFKYELEDKVREHRSDLEELQRTVEVQTDRLSRANQEELDVLKRQHQEELDALKRHYRVELEDEKLQAAREIEELKSKLGSEQDGLNLALHNKDREIQNTRAEMDILTGDLDRERKQKAHLQTQVDELLGTNTSLEGTVRSLQAQVHFLESDSKQQSDSFAEMEARMQEALVVADEARQKLIKEETERRALFNKYQELKGNIRVMCRVRPVLDNSEGTAAELDFPDDKTSAQIYVKGPEEKNALGKASSKTYPFEFDRVFTPQIHNEEVFGEIAQLVQSALDGYNVCIFCYGQTGSGKTYTMSSTDGMIPRATKMIYDTVNKLKEKSWSYTMEGNFVEVYNEELHDLLTPVKEAEGKRKPEIRHDEARKTTTVLNCKSVTLDSEDTVEQMLKHAQNNRSVAATKANERSSRSHSVFILKLIGENSATHERCEGTLNLVDLAGSERLKHSGAEGDRMKETQNINKSLTCLGDVIEALGKGSGHIPYRNSQLTYLLKNSLGGNSKTLMFVMVSPMEAHLKETLTSLRFATKVHNTHIGTAKATKKTRDRIGDS
ncbi:hypothetical protein N8I77_009586 [Diaporthe amygdali]|uniref:Kinesin motor domain-containing protein n=1 Tax=Phomopsis amygdali TaxID=1214568 RepID=A0AAD9SBC8_PHOAM|nr:hypothetical protein N8I77_009586 [Diaporthe amygdali]